MMRMQRHSHIFPALILAVFIFRIALSGPSVVRGRWSLHLSYCLALKNQRRGKLLIALQVRYLLHILMSGHCGFSSLQFSFYSLRSMQVKMNVTLSVLVGLLSFSNCLLRKAQKDNLILLGRWIFVSRMNDRRTYNNTESTSHCKSP